MCVCMGGWGGVGGGSRFTVPTPYPTPPNPPPPGPVQAETRAPSRRVNRADTFWQLHSEPNTTHSPTHQSLHKKRLSNTHQALEGSDCTTLHFSPFTCCSAYPDIVLQNQSLQNMHYGSWCSKSFHPDLIILIKPQNVTLHAKEAQESTWWLIYTHSEYKIPHSFALEYWI